MKECDVDIAILGSGFAGSIAAMILQRVGRRVALIDKAHHPRFAIGESSTPIANMVLRDLAARYDLPRLLPLTKYGTWQQAYPELGCGLKRGFSYFAHSSGDSFVPNKDHSNELLVAASSCDHDSDTHWLRADVDQFLCKEARDMGVAVFEGCDVQRIEHSRSGEWAIHCERDGEPLQVGASFIIDATGEGGVLPKALGIESVSNAMHTNSRAIFAHFHGVRSWDAMFRDLGGQTADHPFHCDHGAQHHLLDGAWLWMLRMNDDVTSVGLVLDAGKHPMDPSISAEVEWEDWLERYPAVSEMFADARLAQSPGRLIRTNRLQRRWKQTAGEDWALLPHTAGFVDALHSTGMAHSLCGVERLVAILDRQWNAGTRSNSLLEYDAIIGREIDLIDELVATCFTSLGQFDLFVVATMVYFAAVTTYERLRCEGDTPPAFLCADDESIRNQLRSCRKVISGGGDPESISRAVADEIAPINQVGLLDPTSANMYHHTVPPM